MNPYADQAKMALRAKLMPYGALLDYRYKNLCVKTSTEALLPVEVEVDETSMTLEQCAKSSIVDDEHFLIAPLTLSLVLPVCNAFLETHPMLLQKLYDPQECPYIPAAQRNELKRQKELFFEQMGEELVLPEVLVLTTPEVDDDTKDHLNNMVDVLYKQCEVLYKKEYTRISADMNAQLARKDISAIRDANKALDSEYESLWRDIEKYTQEERQAIEEANQRYRERKQERERQENGGLSEEEEMKIHSMKLGEFEE